MPRLTKQVPSYRLHKPSGRAVVTLNGKDHYLGPYNSSGSKERYNQLVSEWLANHRSATPATSPSATAGHPDLTIGELLVSYIDFAETYYVNDGRPTRETENIKAAIRPLAALYHGLHVSEFGPIRLKAVRGEMAKRKWSRKTINAQINRIRRVFKWGVENQLVPGEVLYALRAVAPLKRGRTDAPESPGVKPVPEAHVNAAMKHLPPTVQTMVQLQLLTGMRPGELVIMRSIDIDTSGKIWIYHPVKHKTQHHGHDRPILIGPEGQAILTPFLSRETHVYLFTPQQAMQERRAARRANRQTPMTPSQAKRKSKRHPKKRPGDRYTTQSYGYAIRYACQHAFPHPTLGAIKRADMTAHQKVELRNWQQAHTWSPNQLRHNAATRLRKEFGIEAARIILGHRSARTTEIYAELDYGQAVDIMSQVG